MCRIAGTVNYPPQVVANMLDHQKAGGPDLCKLVTKNNVTFGHCLLSIIGHQEQPITESGYMMTFNGCIYNYKELSPYATSDTVALLDNFVNKGIDFTDLNGMWALGLYDSINDEIILSVDRFGQKNLYYYHSGDKFAFASNPGALYPLLETKEINQDALQSYWLLGSVMGEYSILRGIHKLCAGELIRFNTKSGILKRERYYEPKYVDNAIQIIEDVVIDAIDKVKVADVPIHIFLSGGIDSTLVASRFANREAIHLDSCEKVYAQQAADMFGIKLKVVYPQDIDVEECLTDYSLFSGEPTMAGLIPYITAREVSRYGRVAITANGADELFFGYNRTKQDATQEQYDHIFRNSAGLIHNFYLEIPCDDDFSSGRIAELYSYVQFDLNKTLDFASMAHGVEIRSPFLDHRLVEAALSIPESAHRKQGNKTILKNMLKRMGFSQQFLDRPKIGFSLTKQPKDLSRLLDMTWRWVKKEGYLTCDEGKLNGRDYQYLRMSALGFYYWFKAHKL
jgi:asparagine synthase (glutamine-hydrolysing)